MTLTPDDLRRAAIRRLNRVINSALGAFWVIPLFIAAAFLFLHHCADSLYEQMIEDALNIRDRILAAYVKRWPTVQPSGIVLPQVGEWPEATEETAKTVKIVPYSATQHAEGWNG